ncbi:MAG: AMP-binding protein, partial [Pseudonocardia sp.]|nr:AMP-binding protein [Pseudonocardia sp.]
MLRTDLIRTVPELLHRHAQERPEAIAFIDDRRAITYGELRDSTARLAGHLHGLGLQVGDRALIYTDNRVETAE